MRAVKAFQSALDPSIDEISRKDLMRQRLAKQQAVHDSALHTAAKGLTPFSAVSPTAALQLEHRIEINHDS